MTLPGFRDQNFPGTRDRKTFSGIWECKMSPSRDLKSFLKTGDVKKIYVWWEKCIGIRSGIGQFFVIEFSDGKLKQKVYICIAVVERCLYKQQ